MNILLVALLLIVTMLLAASSCVMMVASWFTTKTIKFAHPSKRTIRGAVHFWTLSSWTMFFVLFIVLPDSSTGFFSYAMAGILFIISLGKALYLLIPEAETEIIDGLERPRRLWGQW